MSISPLNVLVSGNTRNLRKKIRGTIAETTDTELGGAMNATVYVALGVVPDRAGMLWQRPIVSGDGTMCAWGVWESLLPPGVRQEIIALAQAEPNIKAFAQGRGGGVPADETIPAFNARWRANVGWTDPAHP